MNDSTNNPDTDRRPNGRKSRSRGGRGRGGGRGRERLIYIPLGGAGEIGMNMYLYGYGAPGKERFIMVDAGVTFPSMDTTPGVDLIMADPAFIAERADRLEAIFVTHAHEDHIGALGMLHGQLGYPTIHARPFTAAHVRRKLEEAGAEPEAVVEAGPMPETIEAGPFTVGFLPVSHSIPESSSLVIDTPAGRIIHTGDFKLDRTPGVGEPFDEAAWRAVAAEGVKALVMDSTNVFSLHPGRSEAVIREPIRALVASAEGMVAATTFASNVARLKTLAEAGIAAGRKVVLLGRAMRRMVDVALQSGVLESFPPTVSPEDAKDMPRHELMVLATGSQGERRAATAQLAQGKYLGFEMREGDMFLFSSKTIPGNEISVARIMNQLSEKGVDVIDDGEGLYHVSGHANRPDLETMHEIVRPDMLIPMHGEHRHLRRHVRIAEAKGIPGVVAPNGSVVDLTGERPRIVDQVETGRIYRDGSELIGAFDGIVRDRIRMALNGLVAVAVVLDDADDPLREAWVETFGLTDPEGEKELAEHIEADLDIALTRAPDKVLDSDDELEALIRRTARKTTERLIGKRPEVRPVISRLTMA